MPSGTHSVGLCEKEDNLIFVAAACSVSADPEISG